MEDVLCRLMAKMFERAIVQDASERFDKRVLLQIHDVFSRTLRESAARGMNFEMHTSSTDPTGDGGTACSVPLQRLRPVSFTELNIGEVHHGQVVYGTLCAEANRAIGIMTLLEDDNGLAVRLAIYNAAPSQADFKRLYRMGTKVAVKEPYFKIAKDGGLLIRVDNPDNVVKLNTEKGERTENLQKGERTENLLHVDLENVRMKGNRCFKERNWDAAAEHYTKCIDAALFQLKEGFSSGNMNIVNGLLNAYSNRAETWLQMNEFESALEDSNDALRIDPRHIKALYRKGRALLGLRYYRAACECLKKADKNSAGHKEIQEALGRVNTLYVQSMNGKYDISDYLLRRGSSSPGVADFVGHLEIKMTEDGRGRGVYATREIRAGQVLLVSNAVAIADESASTATFHVDNRRKLNTASQEDLVAAVVFAARKSQRLLCQLYSLLDSPTPGSLNVPAIDLFETNCQMYEGQEVAVNENLQVDVNRIWDIIRVNSFSGARFRQQEQKFSGLWLLPSFINHSCVPNSSSVDVGSAMFIHASKPIQRGEEITIPYFDALVPLPQRQAQCKNWGFKCKCRRCILEHSFTTSLEPIITQRFEKLYNKANKLTVGKDSQMPFDSHVLDSVEFARLFLEFEEIVRSSHVLISEEEKRWIRASYLYAYILSHMLNRFSPSGQEIEAIQSTVPGDFRNLVMAAAQLKYFQRLMGNENETVITRRASGQAREACISVLGRQSEDVIKALILEYSN